MKKRPVNASKRALGDTIDRSRRRFLKQVSVGAGGSAVLAGVGLPQLAHGQSREVDFSLLDRHRGTHELVPTPPAQPMAAAPMAPALREEQAPADEAVLDAEPEPPAEPEPQVVENRALWVEPGYLILLRWQRQDPGAAQIAALEGATEAVSAYLGEQVTDGSALHDLDRLHHIEHGLFTLLAGLVAPANIQTLHLDHDCTSVCSGFGWPEGDIPLPGEPPMPTY